MQIDLSHPDFQAAIPIMKKIEEAGFEAYFVGGSVRDALLGLPIHDVDIASSAYPQEIKQIFPRTVDTGIQHGTVMVLHHGVGYEVTTFRTESGYQDFRRPDHVTFVRSLKEDLKRRDFTVNALAVRHDGTVIDLFDGLADLDHKVLRAVGDPHARFHEDALRMMRAVRFQSQLGFAIDPATENAITTNAALLAKISVERTATEFTKLLLGRDRQAGLATFIDTGLYAYAPKLEGQDTALRQLTALTAPQFTAPAIGWTLLVHLTGLNAEKLLRAWKQANDLIRLTASAAQLLAQLPEADAWALYQAGEAAANVAFVARRALDASFDVAQSQAAYAALPIHDKAELAIDGKTLMENGFKPGPQLGKTLNQLERAVVFGELPNDQQALLAAAKQ